MVFPKQVQVTPSIADLRSGKVKHPEEVTLSTTVSGLFGPMTNTTVWNTQYDHEIESFREDIVFREGWLNTGRRRERVMPWDVAMSHLRTIGQVGCILFKRKRYSMQRLYGSRDSYINMVYAVKATDSKGEFYEVLLGEREDAELWSLLTRVIQKVDLGKYEVVELTPKVARDRFHPTLGPARVIDISRESSLKLKHQLYRLVEDVARGDAIRGLFSELEREDWKTVKAWTEKAWSALSDIECPDVWD